MSSSTSRSRRHFAAFLVTLALGYGLAWCYSTRLNPEVRFWSQTLEVKRDWAREMRKDGGDLIVFSGGSTTALQFDSALLKEEFGLDNVNAGMHAGAGLDGTVAIATSFLEPGDHLVLTTEPDALGRGGGTMTKLGSQLIAAAGAGESAFFQEDLDGRGVFERLASQRPDLYHTVTMIGKLAADRPLYRYGKDDIRDGGLLSTPIREDHAAGSAPIRDHRLTEDGRAFLQELSAWAESRDIGVSYMMPVYFTPESHISEQRAINGRFLDAVAEIILVIRDPLAGADPDPSHFADTGMHMTLEAARWRSRIAGKALLRKGMASN